MALLQYQTLQVSGTEIVNVGGVSHRGERVGGAVEFMASAMQSLQDFLIRRQVNEAMHQLETDIHQRLRSANGVLVCVAVEERTDPAGANIRNFVAAFVAGSGRTPREALNEFIYRPRMWQSSLSGFRRRESFIWITSI